MSMIFQPYDMALLIDADNAKLSYLEQVLRISEYFGLLKISCAYGDWNKSPLASWCKKIDALDIERIQVDRVGKNATDHRLLIEAGEILGGGFGGSDVRVFIIVSGDGDYTSACKFLQERADQVIVIGNRGHSSDDLRKSCDQFYYLEDLDHELGELEKRYPIPPRELREFFYPLFFAYHDNLTSKKWDWVSYSQLEAKLRERVPDYDSIFGKYMLSEWLRNFEPYFENRDQMIRRVDLNPEMTRYELMFEAYLQTQQADGRAHLGQLGKALRELDPDYEKRFGGKKLSAWVEAYPQYFKLHENYVQKTMG
jgi:NYN domain